MNLKKHLILWVAASVGVAACNGMTDDNEIAFAQCGPTLDFEAINSYEGSFPNVDTLEDAVAIVNGTCSGTRIVGGDGGPLVLTAGHCVGLGDEALVVFNHEDCADGNQGAWGGIVIEQSNEPDYALIELDEDPSVAATRLGLTLTEDVAIIQHPQGLPKVIAEGKLLDAVDGTLRYLEVDTLAGGSGAGVLNSEGHLVGVHTTGDCNEEGGTNAGWTAEEIVRVSTALDETLFR